MTKKPGPNWSDDQIAAGRQFAEGWLKHASTTETAQPLTGQRSKVADVLARHEAALMNYPHVVAVADGICRDNNNSVSIDCIVIYVDKMTSQEELSEDQRFPDVIEGVRIEVVEVGQINALPSE